MSLDRLQPYYGFTRLPFTRRIAPGQLYRSAGHQEAASRIAFLIQSQRLGVITGEVGVGKTVACRAAVAALDASRHTVIYLANPAVGARGLYQQIVAHLGAEPRFHKAALIPQCQELIARERTERGKQVVVIVDEAHLLDAAQLEELRLLTLCRARDYAERAAATARDRTSDAVGGNPVLGIIRGPPGRQGARRARGSGRGRCSAARSSRGRAP